MRTALALLASLLLAACGSGGPPVPDWKSDSANLVERYKRHALKGENTLAEKYFGEAVAATGGAGRVTETARLWLVHCAVRRAMLIADPCAEYRGLTGAAGAAQDEAYYRYLTLAWDKLDPARLPARHARVPTSGVPARPAVLAALDDPLARLIAAGLTVQRGEADDATLDLAIETASERGWTQPLLAYLKLRLARAQAANDLETSGKIEQRLDLVEASLMQK